MSLYDFNRESMNGRAQLVWEHGSLLGTRKETDCTYMLYNMGKFFAEIIYDAGENKIIHVRAFTTRTNLEPYLDQINLSDLGI